MNLPEWVYGLAPCPDDTSSGSCSTVADWCGADRDGEAVLPPRGSTPGGSVIDDRPVVVAGAGGFIGGHLVASLVAQGRQVRAVDLKPLDEWFQHAAAE